MKKLKTANVTTIKLGKENNTYCYAVKDGLGGYSAITDDDADMCRPDVVIWFDSGIYPGIADINQYMCDKAAKLV